MNNKKLTRVLLASFVVICLSMSFTFTDHAEAASNSQLKEKQIFFNEQSVTASVIEQNNYQLVPAVLFKQVGATVEWKSEDRSVIISNGNNKVKLFMGEPRASYLTAQSNGWITDNNLHTRNTLVNDSSFVPLAYTAKKLGISVEYDHANRAARLMVDRLSSYSSSEITVISNNTATSKLSEKDIYWLNRLAEAEAGGESYEGRMAVAATVLNRVETEGFPDTVIDTIFEIVHINGKAYYQFEPVLNQYIYEVTPSAETIQAVQDAINGVDPTGGAVVFYNPTKTSNKWILSRPVVKKIGNHVFAL